MSKVFKGVAKVIKKVAKPLKKIAPIAVDRNRADKRLKQLKTKPKKPYANAPRKPKANLD